MCQSGYYRIWIIKPLTKEQYSYVGVSTNPYRRLSFHLRILKAIWNNELFNFRGEKRKMRDFVLEAILNADVWQIALLIKNYEWNY